MDPRERLQRYQDKLDQLFLDRESVIQSGADGASVTIAIRELQNQIAILKQEIDESGDLPFLFQQRIDR
jgi:hypothetical protein